MTLVVDDCEKFYGDADPTFTCHLDPSTTAEVVQDTVSWWNKTLLPPINYVTMTREAGEKLGTYAINTTKTVPFQYYFMSNMVTVVTPGTLTIKPNPADFSQDGNEYTIHTVTGWDNFCDLLENNDNGYFDGKTVKLGADITVSRMAGSDGHEFTGTFDGNKNTLTFNYGKDGEPTTEEHTAPFRYVGACTIKDLHVAGDIYTSAKYAAGLVAQNSGKLTIENCLSSVNIHSTVSGDGTHGGFVAGAAGQVAITGCAFNGSLLGENTEKCGGFIGWRNTGAEIRNSLFIPTEVTVKKDGSATFARNKVDTYNSYYTYELFNSNYSPSYAPYDPEDADHPDKYNNGHARHTVSGGEGVTISGIAPVGEATNTYDVSGITAYAKGIARGNEFYYGMGDEVSLTLASTAPTGFVFSTYTATAGTLSGTENPYTLTMSDNDVEINAAWGVTYLDENGKMQVKQPGEYTVLEGSSSTQGVILPGGWYVVTGSDVRYNELVSFNGDANIILADGAKLSITNEDDAMLGNLHDLTIFGQSSGTGELVARSTYSGNALHGFKSMIINGGIITTTSIEYSSIAGTNLTVNRGTINTTGSVIGIGTHNCFFNGGTINATGTIKYGFYYSDITLAGATVTSYKYGGCTVKVADGMVYSDGNGHYYAGTLNDDEIKTLANNAISPVDKIYNVSTATTTGGSVTVRNYAVEGQTVTLSVKPDVGCVIGTVSYNDGSEDHEITPVNDVYSFVMPNVDVTVSATFYDTFETIADVSYIDADGEVQTVSTVRKLSSTSTELPSGWYMAESDLTISDDVFAYEDVHLVLKDGVTLTITGYLRSDNLTIYRQTKGSGKLNVSGISGFYVTINGGIVTSTNTDENSAGIIGGNKVVINGGQVKALATGEESAGICCWGTVTLGCSGDDDFIRTNSFYNDGVSVVVKEGQTLYDGMGGSYSGTLSEDEITSIGGKILMGTTALHLANAADNSARIAAADGIEGLSVKLKDRTLTKDGTCNTLCLPFSLSAEQIEGSPLAGAVIKEMDSSTSLSNDGLLTLNFRNAQSIEAGKAYIVKWETKGENIANPVFSGVTISNAAPAETESTDGKVKFVGQYSPFTIDADNKDEILFIGSGNKIGYSKNPRSLKSCRAHFWVQPNGNSAGARVINLDLGDGVTTRIDLVEASSEKNAEGIYTLDGRKLQNKPTQKGVYIMNGKKVVK